MSQTKERQGRLRVTAVGTVLRAQIAGEIDHHSAKALREELDRQIYLHRPHELVLELSGVAFMDSSGLGLIIGRLVTAKEVGAVMTLTGADARTRKIFEMAGLERMRGLTLEGAEEKRKNV
ncbi:MAG: STAS domain-containing protein [Clostridia bacterium]|nr:STAS domain-containing protein [Clostridia bacterium]